MKNLKIYNMIWMYVLKKWGKLSIARITNHTPEISPELFVRIPYADVAFIYLP